MKQILWMALGAAIAAAVGAATAQGVQVLPGCIYLASPPTLSNNQQAPLLCDSTGKLRVTTS